MPHLTAPRGRALPALVGLLLLLPVAPAAAQSDTVTVLREFHAYDHGAGPSSALVEGSDGRLYGVTSAGGAYSDGTVYSVLPDGSDYQTLLDFEFATTGSAPERGLMEASDGRLYGTTTLGGPPLGTRNRTGTIFSIERDGSDFRLLHAFDAHVSGINPSGRLIEGSDGRLYGTTIDGGPLVPPGQWQDNTPVGDGVVYSIGRDGTDFRVLHVFRHTVDGSRVVAGVTEGPDGRLYGVASEGGQNRVGTLFALNRDGSGFQVLRHFHFTGGGRTPEGELLVGSDGFLYGSTRDGGQARATLFRLRPDGTDFTVLHEFTTHLEPWSPASRMIEGADGRLYGVLETGGDAGGLFAMNRDGTGYVLLQEFSPATIGIRHRFALVQAANGRLYGVSPGPGPAGWGTLYSLEPDGDDFQILRVFRRTNPEGFLPLAGVTFGPDGRLYGANYGGGDADRGTLFSLEPDGSDFETLHLFDDETGEGPRARLVLGADQRFYGSTETGGPASGGTGTIFALEPASGDVTVLHAFTFDEGSQIEQPLIAGPGGRLFGVALRGGSAGGAGTVFSLRRDGSGFKRLHAFEPATDGSEPTGIILFANSRLFGITMLGGPDLGGTVYSLRHAGGDFKVHYALGGDDDLPRAPTTILRASNNLIYGLAEGKLFRTRSLGGNLEVLHRFEREDEGLSPRPHLFEASDGRLYGMTARGGVDGTGTIYSIDKHGRHFAVHYHFGRGARDLSGPSGFVEGPDGRLFAGGGGGEFDHGTVWALERPLRILADPESQTVRRHRRAEFHVAASGPGPLTYQWYHDGEPIDGARDATLELKSVKSADAGRYHAEVTGRGTTVTSAEAVLVVP